MSDEADRRRVRRAAVHVGLLVGAASAVVVTAGVALLVAVLLLSARPELHHNGEGGGRSGPPDGDRIVVDVDRILPWVVALGLAGVALLALVAWFAARRAVAPLAGALRLQRRFVADASHEIRTPLTALTSRTQILERRYRRGEDLTDTLAALRADASVMDAVLTDMLLTAEGTATDAEPAVVDAALTAAAATVAPLAEEAGVRVRVGQGDDAGLRVRLPRVTLDRLCVALLDNAVQHTPAGGEVALSARSDGRGVAIRVRDGGTGIADADRERIFERFARGPESGRRRGFGLGLALVREAAEAAGGRIEIERTSAAGTTMLLWLPQAA
ncbi:ATP-binding region ATPase domain protein [Microbacterium laevaniformans OR221]|uniref:sensor histidine kinase n=1 Tax=uncultured Microbacterium sp. TaxID=191216 RepID=UPI0002585CBD|nr:HAMP domain-containing sensor histidine kinase [uncultured Microbacterium sp.]EIC08530.1 ATP-binding region ATPase domain protein [Microbacterium laevaniformans OR221]